MTSQGAIGVPVQSSSMCASSIMGGKVTWRQSSKFPYQIAMALSLAANVTGADYDYLVKTAARESNFQVQAQAKTSTARGLFQFHRRDLVAAPSRKTVRVSGSATSPREYSRRVAGRYYVPNKTERKNILNLRNDPKVSALLAGAYTKRNGEALEEGIGRKPTAGELYMAHFLGARDAVRLIKMAHSQPHRRADRSFAAAAKANRRIFYDGRRARTAREVYRILSAKYDRTGRHARPDLPPLLEHHGRQAFATHVQDVALRATSSGRSRATSVG